MRTSRNTECVVCLGFALAGCMLAMSGSAAAAAIEEIVVTATKRATVLQDTSESVQVLGANELNEIGADSFIDYFRLVPNLSQSDNLGPGNRRYAIRGISSAGEPLVAVYYDESPTLGSPGDSLDAGGSQPDFKLWDIERIEVLKGPQGTLYGSGSMGGTIRVISNKPDASALDFAARAGVETTESGGEGFTTNVMMNLPILEDQLAVRVTGYHHDLDGFLDEAYLGDHDTNDEETSGGRFAIRWTPNDRLTLTSTTYYQDTETGSNFEVFEGFGSDEDPTAAQLSRTPYEDEALLSNVTAEYDHDWVNALYSFSYYDRKVDRFNDQTRFVIFAIAGIPPAICPESALQDGSCIALVNGGPFGTVAPLNSYGFERTLSRTHEVRFTSNTDSRWQWTVGGFYENRYNFREGQVGATDADGNLIFNPDGTIQNRIFARNNWGEREHYSAFGELSYDFMPGWQAAFGFRWFKTDRQEEQNLVQNLNPAGPTGILPVETESDDDTVFRFKVSWDVNDDVLLYAMAAEGFRVGGPNQPAGFDASAPPFDSDSLWNYELGWKTSWANDRVTLNGAVFYIDWSDVQYLTSDATGAFEIIGNAGDATVPGFELELRALPFERFEVSAAVGYTHGRFDGTQPRQALLINQTEDGDRFPGVPDWSTSLFAQYTHPLSGAFGGFDAIVSGDWAYRSSKTTGLRPAAGDFRKLDDYHQVNVRAGLQSEHWDIWLRVNNLFDALPELSGRIVDNEPFRFATLRPRTVGLTVTYRY